MKLLLAFVTALGLSAECNPVVPNPNPNPGPTPWPLPTDEQPPAPSPAPAPTPAPPVRPSTWEACDQAEANATARGCPLKGSGSSSWADVCRNAANNAVSMHQRCVADAKDCPAIAACLKSTK